MKDFFKIDVKTFNARDWFVHLGVLVNVVVCVLLVWYWLK